MRNMQIQLDNAAVYSYSYEEGSEKQQRKNRVDTGWNFILNVGV